MRAQIKLTTGLIPVALGMAMALMPGMAEAEDKVAQSQAQTNSVSAKTTQPSVGHRPATPKVSNWSLQGGAQLYNPSLLLPVGSTLYAHGSQGLPADKDNLFGANEFTNDAKCRIYRIAPDSSETLIHDSGNRRCDSDNFYITENEVGHKIKIAHYRKTEPSSYAGYLANPTESLESMFITNQVVSDIYDVRKTKISPEFMEISHSDPKGIKATIKVANYKNIPVTGLDIKFATSASSENAAGAKLTHTTPVDNGDGSYTTYVKSSHPNSSYWVDVLVNGTVGNHTFPMIFWTFN